jgi:predicted PurR-regulated permease PerM
MLGIDARAARAAWTVFLLALVIATAYVIRETLMLFMLALLFAYMLTPVVALVERFTPPRISARVSLAIVYLALVGIIVALGVTIGSQLAEEANSLATRLPELARNPAWIDTIPLPGWLEQDRARIVAAVKAQFATGGNGLLPYVKGFGEQLLSGAKYLLYIVLVPILSFFFLKDGRRMREHLVDSFVDEKRKPMVDDIFDDIDRLLGEYIRALVLLSVASFIAHCLFLMATGASYGILLAAIAALGEFIPVVGPATAGIVILLVAGLSGYDHMLLYAIFWALFRTFQDYVISPYVMGRGVKLNPVLVLFGVLAGERIGGVAGMFFSVPVIATLRVIFVRVRRIRTPERVTARTKA